MFTNVHNVHNVHMPKGDNPMTHSPAIHAYVSPAEPEVDIFSLPLLNDHNIREFREHHGVRTHGDLQRAMATREVLAAAHHALLESPFDPVDYGDTVDGLESAIDTLDAVITPTEEALSDYFVEDWILEVVNGECRARFMPITDRDAA